MSRRLRSFVLALFAPLLANAAALNIPSQPLAASLQELAKQSGTQIIVFSKLVKGRDAPAVNGAPTAEAALDVLLHDTNLTYRALNERTIEVTAKPADRAADAFATESAPAAPIEEIEIYAQIEKLSAMRREIDRLEDEFVEKYNAFNPRREFDVDCDLEADTGTHVMQRACRAAFVTKAQEEEAQNTIRGGIGLPAQLVILMKTPEYRKNMVEMVRAHPELLDLLKERAALVKRYDSFRRQKLKGKVFVWD